MLTSCDAKRGCSPRYKARSIDSASGASATICVRPRNLHATERLLRWVRSEPRRRKARHVQRAAEIDTPRRHVELQAAARLLHEMRLAEVRDFVRQPARGATALELPGGIRRRGAEFERRFGGRCAPHQNESHRGNASRHGNSCAFRWLSAPAADSLPGARPALATGVVRYPLMWREQCPKEARLQTAFAVFCQSSSIWKPVASTRAATPFWNWRAVLLQLRRRAPDAQSAVALPGRAVTRHEHGSGLAALHRHRSVHPGARREPNRKCSRSSFGKFARAVKARRLQPRNRRRSQRGVRPSVHHVGRQPQRHQTQSVPPVFIHRHGVARRRRVRADGAEPGVRRAPELPTTAMKRIRRVTTQTSPPRCSARSSTDGRSMGGWPLRD